MVYKTSDVEGEDEDEDEVAEELSIINISGCNYICNELLLP